MKDYSLPEEILEILSMEVRRQIKAYIISGLQKVSFNYECLKKIHKTDFLDFSNAFDSSNNSKLFSSILTKREAEKISSSFYPSTQDVLGSLRKYANTNREIKHHKPSFLKNRIRQKKHSEMKENLKKALNDDASKNEEANSLINVKKDLDPINNIIILKSILPSINFDVNSDYNSLIIGNTLTADQLNYNRNTDGTIDFISNYSEIVQSSLEE